MVLKGIWLNRIGKVLSLNQLNDSIDTEMIQKAQEKSSFWYNLNHLPMKSSNWKQRRKWFQKAAVSASWIHFWITEVFYRLVGDWENHIWLKNKTILSFSLRNVQFLIWSSSGVITVLLMGLEEWPWITSDKKAYGLWMLMQLFDTLYISVLYAANYVEQWDTKWWQTYHGKDALK